jgi:hypothetical protein
MLSQPELSTLLDALEQSACNPEIASVLCKSLVRILQLSAEKTIASFKMLNAVPRVLKVACIQAQESRRFGNTSPSVESNYAEAVQTLCCQKSDPHEIVQSWIKCMNTSMELFTEFLSIADDGRSLVLHSSACVDCLFDLFWEEGLRSRVLKHILELMKVFI